MGIKPFLFLLLFLFFIPLVQAQSEKITMDVKGNCIDYEVTLKAEGFENGCYDVKIDVKTAGGGRAGEIYDPMEGWKSSYYYIKDGFCVNKEKDQKDFIVRAKTYKDFSFVAILKMNSRSWTSDYYEIKQNCPQQTEKPEYFFLGALVAVLVLVAGLALYVKKFK
ncbi:MAG: hypothetical protein KAT37_04550 [Candidatus Aenigmarchaeota archaeon]|nr:hypothetical protein [Candidatus Aenigmarchaeota archaeon]